MIIDSHTVPCYFADRFCKPTAKNPRTLVWYSDDFYLVFTLVDFLGRMIKLEELFWIETDSFIHFSPPTNLKNSGLKRTPYRYVHAPNTEKST